MYVKLETFRAHFFPKQLITVNIKYYYKNYFLFYCASLKVFNTMLENEKWKSRKLKPSKSSNTKF